MSEIILVLACIAALVARFVVWPPKDDGRGEWMENGQ